MRLRKQDDSMQEEEVKQESPKTVEEKPKRFLAKDNKEYNEKVLECNSFSALINIIKENKYSIRFIADCLGVPPSSLNQWRTYDSLPRNKDTRTKLSIALFNKFNVPLNKGCQLLGV